VSRFGDRIAVAIDARDGMVKTRGWERRGNVSSIELARRVAALGVKRIIFTDIARDGVLGGLNVEQTCAIARETGVKVTASGGISSLEDIERLDKAGSAVGVDSVIIGRAIYERRFTLGKALQLACSSVNPLKSN
jgi:phosphoribosylformimino-5-aminoimidazole carboxamide ribotide isomerase